jgi:hypothetical protein
MAKTKKATAANQKDTIIRAMRSRSILLLCGFLTENENRKVFQRIMKYAGKHKVEITEKELWGYKLH